jgi:hypothetical protein
MGRIALAASLALVIVTVVVFSLEGAAARGDGDLAPGRDASTMGPLLAAIALAVTAASIALVVITGRRTRRLLEASAPEGGVVLGMSSAGINLTHLPLLEWDAIAAVGIAERRRGVAREVTVALAVPDVDAARARIIDARLTHLVHPFPRRPDPVARHGRRSDPARPEPGFLSVDLGDLVGPAMIDEIVCRLEEETTQRAIPLHRVDSRRRLGPVLRPSAPADA